MHITLIRFVSFTILFQQLLCNTSLKRNGILPIDNRNKFQGKNREFNSIRDASKEEHHSYPMLNVDMRKGIGELKVLNTKYNEEGSGDFDVVESSGGNDADDFYSRVMDDFSGVDALENGT